MRTLLLPAATLLLSFTALAIPACANGDVVIEDAGETAPTTTTTTTTPVPDAGTTVKDAGPTCVSSCSADSECQNSCAPVSTGANCCDTKTKRCYVNASACPVDVPDADPPPGPY